MKKYFQAPWSLKDAVFIILIVVTLILLAGIGLDLFEIEKAHEASKNKSFYFVSIFLLQWVLALVPILIFTARKYKLKWKHFGFAKIGILRTIGLVIGAYLMYLAITFIISTIIIYKDVQIPGYQVQESLLPLFGTDLFGLIIAGITIILVAPFIEELIFRGFLLRTLSNKMGIFYGSIISALIFAMLHMPWHSIIPIFILGLIINSLVIRSKSLWPAIAFHTFNNAMTFLVQVLIIKEVIQIDSLV